MLSGADVFDVAMSLSNSGSGVTVLASHLGTSLASGNAGKSSWEEEDLSHGMQLLQASGSLQVKLPPEEEQRATDVVSLALVMGSLSMSDCWLEL